MLIDRLEERRLFSGIELGAGGRLRVLGTSGNDTITFELVHKTKVRIQLNDTLLDLSRKAIRTVTVGGLAGNDYVTLGNFIKRCELIGGDGDDSLSAAQGNSNDALRGGEGHDYLYGGDGNDLLDGGLRADTMLGASGNDTLVIASDFGDDDDLVSGGPGTDTVDGSTYIYPLIIEIGNTNPNNSVSEIIYPDIETFIGGQYDDSIEVVSNIPVSITGGLGKDTIIGNESNDTIVGGPGVDSLVGAGGVDTFISNDGGFDTVDGGAGTDILNAALGVNNNPDFDSLFNYP